MIRVLNEGEYKLAVTPSHEKILFLDRRTYTWLFSRGKGQLLAHGTKNYKTDHLLAQGRYRLYDVVDEAELSGYKHLELCLGGYKWQGYILLKGLPTARHPKAMIFATKEIISSPTSPG